MTTNADILTRHNVAVPAHLEADAEVPVLAALQIQGDVAIIPTRAGKDKGVAVPAVGVPVVRGEAGGNTHLLVGDGVAWRAVNQGAELGVVTVADGGTGWLLHPEHGAMGLAPGCYRIRRQREQADEIRLLAD